MKGTRKALMGAIAAVFVLGSPTSALAEGPDPVGGDPSTGPSTAEPTAEGLLAITDVRVGTHDGFDRVTFETAGEGHAGWRIRYDDSPVEAGRGEPIDVEGNTTLSVVLSFMAMPGDEPEGTAMFEDDVAGPEGGVIHEIVNDLVFEGEQPFYIGLDEELPYVVARLEDPNRVVIDIMHDDVPVGPVETGLGGAATTSTMAFVVAGLGVLLMAGGGTLLVRRNRA
jgi:LPXTG-motif cell wall-anchored protein